MSITVIRNQQDIEEATSITIVVNGRGSIARFRELAHRATNLWPDAHPEIKEFADLMGDGEIRQAYYEQADGPKYITDKEKEN